MPRFILLITLFVQLGLFAQSKKDQIEILQRQRDSLYELNVYQHTQIVQLNKQSSVALELQNKLQLQNEALTKDLLAKDKELNNLKEKLTASKGCLGAQTEASIETLLEGEPILNKRSVFNGLELINSQEGENETYPSRLYSFQYRLTGMDDDLPAGLLFNDKRPELESKLNKIAQEELLKQGVPKGQIVTYSFPMKPKADELIYFFIEFDKVTFYLEQYMYEQVNDRLEITFPLSEIVPYLINAEYWTLNEKRKFYSGHEIPIHMSLILKSIEEGDAGYYIDFIDPVTGEEFQFSYYNWEFREGTMDEFAGTWWRNGKPTEKQFTLQLSWRKVKEYEYRGFEEGNVETGKLIDAYVLDYINPGWSVPE